MFWSLHKGVHMPYREEVYREHHQSHIIFIINFNVIIHSNIKRIMDQCICTIIFNYIIGMIILFNMIIDLFSIKHTCSMILILNLLWNHFLWTIWCLSFNINTWKYQWIYIKIWKKIIRTITKKMNIIMFIMLNLQMDDIRSPPQRVHVPCNVLWLLRSILFSS